MQSTENEQKPQGRPRLFSISRRKLRFAAEMVEMGVSAQNIGTFWQVPLQQVYAWMEECDLHEDVQDNDYTRLIEAMIWLRRNR